MLQIEQQTFAPSITETIDYIATTAPVLVPYLDRVAATKEAYSEIYRRLQPTGATSELDWGGLARLTDEDIADTITPRTQRAMTGVYLPIAEALAGAPAEADISWQGVVAELLDNAHEQPTEADQHMQLLSALTASLISDDMAVRRSFIAQVHHSGLASELATAIDNCGLTILCPLDDGSLKTRRYNHYRSSFTRPKEAVDYYLQYTDPEANNVDTGKAKLRQRELAASYAEGSTNPHSVAASEQESRAEQRPSAIIDPHKIERFALQQMFLGDQLLALFPDTNLHTSPFAMALRERSELNYIGQRNDLDELIRDTREVTDELTEAVAATYKPSPYSYEPSTHRQAAGQRFREIAIRTGDLREISKYIDYSGEYTGSSRHMHEIQEVSRQAADAPRQARVLLSYVVREARRYQKQTGDKPLAEELHELCLHNRKHLIRLSMLNIGDLSVLTQSGVFQAVSTQDGGGRMIHGSALQRQPDGTLGIGIPLAREQAKGSAETYEGTTLGCPAGRVGHAALHHSAERGRHATNSLIDYTVEAIINEAYRRGIFELSPQLPTSE